MTEHKTDDGLGKVLRDGCAETDAVYFCPHCHERIVMEVNLVAPMFSKKLNRFGEWARDVTCPWCHSGRVFYDRNEPTLRRCGRCHAEWDHAALEATAIPPVKTPAEPANGAKKE